MPRPTRAALVLHAALASHAALAMTACSAEPPEPARPPPVGIARPTAAPVASAPPTAPPPPRPAGSCAVDDDCGKVKDGETLALCEEGACVDKPREELLAWAKKELPAVAGYARRLKPESLPWLASLTKVDLHVDARALNEPDAKCLKLTFVRGPEGFTAKWKAKKPDDDPDVVSCESTLTLGDTLGAAATACKTKSGGGRGYGYGRGGGIAQALVATSRPQGRETLDYRGDTALLRVRCSTTILRRPAGCQPETCESCELVAELVRPPAGKSVSIALATSQTCEACPPNPKAALLPRLQRVVAGLQFVVMPEETRGTGGPVFFRDAGDCKRALTEK